MTMNPTAQRRLETTIQHLKASNTAAVANPSGRLYTVDGAGCLTEAQRDAYERDGFLVVPGLVSEDEVALYKEHFRKICNEEVERVPTMTIMRDVSLAKKGVAKRGEDAITKIQDWQDDEVLFQYCKTPAVLKYMASFTGEDIRSVHTMFINKPPDTGALSSRHPLHQDLFYFPFRPANRIACCWTAVDNVHRGNGCLVVLPGTHKGRLMEHGYPDWEGGVNKAYHGVKDMDSFKEAVDKRVYVEMKPGDCVFFHPLLLHGSGANRTTGYRKAISCHYASADCEYIDVAGTIQAEIADEVVGMAKRKLGEDLAGSVSFQDVWRFKSRLCQGKEGKMV